MGFFDGISSMYNWVSGKVSSAYNWVSDKASNVYTKAEKVATIIHQDARDLVGGVGSTVQTAEKEVINLVGKMSDNSTKLIGGLGNNAQGAIGDVSKGLGNIAMPLAIGAVAVAGLYLFAKK